MITEQQAKDLIGKIDELTDAIMNMQTFLSDSSIPYNLGRIADNLED